MGPSDTATILEAMMVTKAPGGADLIEMTPEEYADYVERTVEAAVGMSSEEFRRAYLAVSSPTRTRP
jgi:hypothetical protein